MADEQFPAAVTALEEYHNIEQQMAEPEVASNPDKMRKLGRRHAELGAIVSAYTAYKQVKDDLEAAREMASEDPDFAEEAKRLEGELPAAEEKLRTALIPRDPDDARDTIMEIKAGTGGEEAALFAGDLLRMYMRYAEKRGWSVTVQSENTTELGGVKDVQIAIRAKGTPAPEDGVWASLKYEGGVHRVQRVPVTESQGRIHTSTATVAVMPQAEEVDFALDIKDLRIDTFRSSGAGGQHITKTSSAIRVTHIPTGTVVECQNERSQFQNKDKALEILRSRLLAQKQKEQQDAINAQRQGQVGTGDRSEKIRTYNFPQGRLTDHRINLTLYKLLYVMEGDLGDVLQALQHAREAEQLAELEGSVAVDVLENLDADVAAQIIAEMEPDDAAEPGTLGDRLRATFDESSGGHGGAAAIAFMVFVLAYTPCLATIAEQKNVIGWKLTGITVGAQLVVAWVLAVGVFQLLRWFW